MDSDNLVIIPSEIPISAFKTITPHYPSTRFIGWDKITDHLPKIVKSILDKYSNVALAGGSLVTIADGRKLYSSQDYDLFILGGENWDIVHDIVKMANGSNVNIGRGVVNITYLSENKPSIQLIISHYKDVCELLSKFDIELCKIAYCNNKIYVTELAEYSIKHRIMPITNVYYTTTTRFMKYIHNNFGIATLYDRPISRINNLKITYDEYGRVSRADIIDYEMVELEKCPYAHCKHRTYYQTANSVAKPFIFYISTTDYIADLNYGELTLREYIDMFGIEYAADKSLVNIDEVYASMFDLSLTFTNAKITRVFIENLIDSFYSSLDKKIDFWLDSFNTTPVPITVELLE